MMSTRACYFVGLSAVRAFSIIGLLLVFSSSIFVMVNDVRAVNEFMAARGDADTEDCDYIENSTVPNQAAGVFWAILNRILIILEVIILLLAELSHPIISRFFDRFFPVLGPNFGLGALGVFECLIGATILSHHVDDFSLVSAFFLFSVGCINILLGLIFRERAKVYRSIGAFRDARNGGLPTHADSRPAFGAPSQQYVASHFISNPRAVSQAPSYTDEKNSIYGGYGASEKSDRYEQDYRNIAAAKAGYGFGRQGEKAAGLKGFLIAQPEQTLPRFASYPTHTRAASVASGSSRASSPRRGREERLADSGAFDRSRSPSPAAHPVPTFHSSPTAL